MLGVEGQRFRAGGERVVDSVQSQIQLGAGDLQLRPVRNDGRRCLKIGQRPLEVFLTAGSLGQQRAAIGVVIEFVWIEDHGSVGIQPRLVVPPQLCAKPRAVQPPTGFEGILLDGAGQVGVGGVPGLEPAIDLCPRRQRPRRAGQPPQDGVEIGQRRLQAIEVQVAHAAIEQHVHLRRLAPQNLVEIEDGVLEPAGLGQHAAPSGIERQVIRRTER